MKVSFSLENFKFSLENFNLDLENSPQLGPLLCGSLENFILDRRFHSRLKISIPDENLEFFQSLGPLGYGVRVKSGSQKGLTAPYTQLTSALQTSFRAPFIWAKDPDQGYEEHSCDDMLRQRPCGQVTTSP